MRNRRHHLSQALVGLLLVLLLLHPISSEAILGVGDLVYDPANHYENIIQAVQSVFIVANQVIDLTPLDELIAMDGFLEDLDAIREVMGDLRGLGWDLRSLDGQFEHLFGMEGLPESSKGLYDWQLETRQVVREARQDAMRVQTIIRTLRRTFDHLLGLMSTAARAIGNLQAAQTVSQAQQKVAQLLSEQQLTRTVHERAESIQAMTDPTETEILNRINCNLWRHWPGMPCGE